ncbi:MAG: histidine kinase [Planctomycetota bacterium]
MSGAPNQPASSPSDASSATRLGDSVISCPGPEFTKLLDLLPIGIVLTRVDDGMILFANRRLAELARAPLETIIGTNASRFYAKPEEREEILAKVKRDGSINDSEFSVRRVDGTAAMTKTSVHPFIYEGIPCLITSVIDITDLKDTERSLRNQQRLLIRMLELHERDRQLIGFEIHDGLIQDITAGVMFLQGAMAQLERQQVPVPEQLSMIEHLLHETINEARRLIDGLQPPVLNEAGLAIALEGFIGEFRGKYPIEVSFHHNLESCRFLPTIEMAVYRVVQESLNNVAKHSQAEHCWVHVVRADHRLIIYVRDDGIGFDTQSIRKRRYGIVGIRERARLLGGLAIIDSEITQGTQITVQLPTVDSLLDVVHQEMTNVDELPTTSTILDHLGQSAAPPAIPTDEHRST